MFKSEVLPIRLTHGATYSATSYLRELGTNLPNQNIKRGQSKATFFVKKANNTN